MKGWKEKLYKFLQDRNGIDELGVFLTGAAFALLMIGLALKGLLLSLLGLGFLIYEYVRALSKNLSARQEENRWFVAEKECLRFKMQSEKLHLGMRKTHKYLKCPKCRKKMRVPRGKGKIEVTCLHCGEKFTSKS